VTTSPPLDPLSVLGERIRERRKAVGLSLRALAGQLDMSASALSQIETGRSQPSVASLYEISRALNVPLDSLFLLADHSPRAESRPAVPASWSAPEREGGGEPVLRAADRPRLGLDSGVNWELLTAEADPDVDFLYVSYPPASCSSEGMLHHPGREYGLVLKGTLTVTIEAEDRLLRSGDSIHLDSSIPHRLRNDGQVPAYAVWVVLRNPRT